MTDGTTAADPAPAPASGSQRRKPRHKRNPGKKNDSGSQQKGGKGGASKGGNKKSTSGGNNNNNTNGPPPPPQIKLTIRNIQNSEKFGSVKSVLEELVAKLMEACVEKKANSQYAIEMDRTAVRYLITEEERIKERREQIERDKARLLEKKEEENENETNNSNENSKNTNGNGVGGDKNDKIEEGKEEKLRSDPSTEAKDTPNANNKLDVILAPKTPSKIPTINARPLYVVPPRKTRRRGERGGTAYVLLIGPKIEKKKPVTAIPKEGGKNSSSSKPEDDSDKQGPTAVSDPADGIKQTPETTSPEGKIINYPQELAKGRLLLSNALKALIELMADAQTQEYVFSGCIVEQSMNGKTWKVFQKNSSRPDRREGTIQSTADFKEWMENVAKQKEELKARPKPVPGGGVIGTTAASTTANGEEVEEDGQVVSSLVLHIRNKKLEAKRKKSQKKKKKDESNNAAASSNSGSNDKGDATAAAAGSSENDKKKKKRSEKKNRKNNIGGTAPNGVKSEAAAAAAATKKAKRKKNERMKKKEKAKAVATAAAAGGGGGSKAPTAVLKPQLPTT